MSRVMKAIVYERYGSPDVLELREVPVPEVEDDEVLVRVHAASVNIADWFFLTGRPWPLRFVAGLFRPKRKILGRDVAGTVEAFGAKVTRFHPGDEVFGEIDGGAFAEYAAASEDRLVRKPSDLTFEQAAAAPLAGMTALRGLRRSGEVRPGDEVLVNGASGAVGTFSVQVAKALGANVTGVCSTRNVEMVRSIGADAVIDYEREDLARTEQRFDLMFDLVGSLPLSDCRRLLNPDGVYVSSVGQLGRIFRVALAGKRGKPRMVLCPADPTPEDLAALRDLLEDGKVTPVIDRTYALGEVPDALRHQGRGHARGKKVVTVLEDEAT